MESRNIRNTGEDCRQCHASFAYAEEILTAKLGTAEYRLRGQESRIAAFAPATFQDASWIIVVNAPRDEVTGFIQTNLLETLALFGIVGAVVGFALLSVYRKSQQEVLVAEKTRHLLEKEKLVEQLREAGDYLENLFESANAPIIVWNPELRITRYNRACQRLTGHTADDVVGQELGVLFPVGSREESIAKILDATKGNSGESPEIPILRKNGTIRIALWNAANILNGDRTAVIATIAQGQDITERKRAEKMRADFVSFVSHQLRTPLSGIRWSLELVEQDESLPKETAAFVADARVSAERLIRLVNELLAVSRLEGGRLAVHPQPVDLADMTADVINELMPMIQEKHQQVSVSGAGPAPFVNADPTLVREVVQNLLGNAVKYTPDGGSIGVSMGAAGDIVRWTVRDTGIGIGPEAQAHLFEKFYRADNATVASAEGTGLGLYIVRLILEQSGGHVWCESQEGRGSTFTFVLPFAPAPEQNEAQ
jgi:PAS domain S-box-containing protein